MNLPNKLTISRFILTIAFLAVIFSQSRFHETRTAHFTVLFEGPADQPLAGQVVERLEAAYSRVGDAVPQPVRNPAERP